MIRHLTQLRTAAEIREQLWTARIGDYQKTAFPIQHADRMTFYIEDGTKSTSSAGILRLFETGTTMGNPKTYAEPIRG